jgi:hypothetical protein
MDSTSYVSPAARRRETGPARILAALALGGLIAACGAAGSTSSSPDDPPTDPAAASTGAGGAAPGSETAEPDAGPLDGIDKKALCARFPLTDLDGLVTEKPVKVEAHDGSMSTTCVFKGPRLTVASVIIGGYKPGPLADFIPKSADAEPVPEFGTGAVVMGILPGGKAGYQVMAEHPNGHVVTAQLNGYADVQPGPTRESTVKWYRSVASRL